MNRVIVTGACGFIGSNLSLELVKQGYDVVGIDDLSTGFIDNIRREKFSGLPGIFTFIRKNINAEDLYKDFIGADTVFHLAALPRVSYSIDHSLEADTANIHGTLSVLEAARIAGVRRVVFSSSSSIYGGMAEFPTKECSIPNPLSPYALHKLTGEYYMGMYSNLHNLDTVCLRYFNVIGILQRAGSAYATVIPAFMEQAINKGTCIINGDGSISRDFCPVENVVQANLLAANFQDRLNGEVFNIACGESHTINEVYEKIYKLSGNVIKKIHGPNRQGDPKKSLGDITKAKIILGYNPSMTFDESLKIIWNWWNNGCK